MTWQEACKKSSLKKAYRVVDGDTLMTIEIAGDYAFEAYCDTNGDYGSREVLPGEFNVFTDWQPFIKAKGR